jgi:predicted GH43/DUF377 family glycosyl hydrolase
MGILWPRVFWRVVSIDLKERGLVRRFSHHVLLPLGDPRLVKSEDGTYVLTYTQWNRQATDIGIATSTDLIHWTKHGPALVGEKYQHFDYKSASIHGAPVQNRRPWLQGSQV